MFVTIIVSLCKKTCDKHLLCSHVQTCQGITGYAVKGRSSFWSNSTCNCFSTSLCWCRSTSRRKVTSVFTNYSFHFLIYFMWMKLTCMKSWGQAGMLQQVLYGTAKDPNDSSNTDTVIMQSLMLLCWLICKLKRIL